jgi:hypothetical protein
MRVNGSMINLRVEVDLCLPMEIIMTGSGIIAFHKAKENILIDKTTGNMLDLGKKEFKMEKVGKHFKMALIIKAPSLMVKDMVKESLEIMMVDIIKDLFSITKFKVQLLQLIFHISMKVNGRMEKWTEPERVNGTKIMVKYLNVHISVSINKE